MKSHGLVVVALGMLCISGCGVTLEARRVTSTDAARPTPSAVSGSGVVYALPRTDFEIVQPVKVSSPTSGPLQDTFDNCQRSCDAGGGGGGKACEFNNKPKAKWAPPTVRTVAGPDYSRLYQVSAAADAFQSLDFKFDIGANGVLDKADTGATNMAYEILTSVLTTAIKVASAAAPAIATQLKFKNTTVPTLKARTCYEVSTDVDKLTANGTGTLKCDLLQEIRSCMAHFESEIDANRVALNTLFDHTASSAAKIDSKLLDSLAANRKARIDAAISKRDAAATLYGLGEGKPKEATYQVVIPMPGPVEFTTGSQTAQLGKSIADGTARILGISDNATDLLPPLLENAKSSTRVYRVDTTMPSNISIVKGDESTIMGGGYRYRIPTFAHTKLSVFTDTSSSVSEFLPQVQYFVIAQFGPIAALPSDFKGKGGHVMVKLWPDSGGLQTVAIGAEPIPSAAVTGVVDEAFNQFKARQAADPELDKLTRQQKILTLQKEIKDLQDALNK